MADEFDLVVIGAGPGGYSCAIRAAQLKMKVGIVEKRKTYGGTCLNVGCIPSKALLHCSELFEEASHGFGKFGFNTSKPELDIAKLHAHKDSVVKANTQGISFLLKKNKIIPFHGLASFIDKNTIEISKEDGSKEVVKSKNFVIATGSDVAKLPGVEFDGNDVISSTEALELQEVPKKLIVVGAGVIGLELGSVWRRLGAEVEVVEFLDEILPGMDLDICKNARRILGKQGMKFKLSHKVTAVNIVSEAGLQVEVEDVISANKSVIETDKVLVSIGRVPYTECLELDNIGIKTDERNRVIVDNKFRSNVDNIFAIGDVIEGPMLAHKAEEDGVMIAEILDGQYGEMHYNLIPGVVYTNPEIASVGLSEEQAKSIGYHIKTGKFPFMANGRARAMGQADGFVKIIADKKSDRVLGAHIIGPYAGEMIAQMVIAMEYKASTEDIARICFAHPTLSEAVKGALMDVDNRAIHI